MTDAEEYNKPITVDFIVAGVEMTDGDKRLMRLLTLGLGMRHPAVKDLMALLLRAKEKQRATE